VEDRGPREGKLAIHLFNMLDAKSAMRGFGLDLEKVRRETGHAVIAPIIAVLEILNS
jgi:hypothetical protein